MNQYSTRRHFIKTAGLAGVALATTSFDFIKIKYKPLLSFSTLGCPDWTFDTILNFAANNGYDGIELRGILRQLDLTKCPEFNSKENILASRKRIEEKKLRIVDLGSSAGMHYADPVERKKNLDEAKSFIQLAQQLNCPYIRVFPNNFPKDQERNQTIDLIIKGLLELGNYAKDYGVTVLMETHGELVQSADIEKIMQSAAHPNVGLVWDIVNMWSVTKEPPAQVYATLKKYIHHTHIKDLKFVDGKEHYVLMGKGETPIFDAIDILAKDGYKGYYSFEWEKLWHPEIDEPEVAIAYYSKVMKQHFKE
ncbi:MAG: sugar phosphate isomerase/epimerase family protein [Ginsengibacter sp.]